MLIVQGVGLGPFDFCPEQGAKIFSIFCLCTIDMDFMPLQNVSHGLAIGAGPYSQRANKMKIRVYKSKFNGWTANSEIEIGQGRVLQINTCKRNGGAIVSHASVAKRDGAFLSHIIFQDYSARVAIGGNRATEKAVAELHQTIDFDSVIAAASAHYEGGH